MLGNISSDLALLQDFSTFEKNPSTASASVTEVVAQVRALLAQEETSQQLAKAGKSGAGYLQFIRSVLSETHPKTFSGDLYRLAEGQLHDSYLGAIARQLLQILSESELPDASRAAHRLNVLAGRGGTVGEYAAQALRQVSQGEHYGPLAMALASTSFVGKGVGLLARRVLGSRGVVGLGLEIAGGAAKLGVESLAFPVASALGRGVFGQSMIIQDYWGEATHGLQIMGGLGLGARLGRLSYLSFHGVKASGAVTRFRTLSLFTKPASHLMPELGVLTAINYKQQGGELSFNLIGGMATMVQLRGAQGLNVVAFPGLPRLMQRLDFANYQAVKNAGAKGWQGVACRFEGGSFSESRLAFVSAGRATTQEIKRPQKKMTEAMLHIDAVPSLTQAPQTTFNLWGGELTADRDFVFPDFSGLAEPRPVQGTEIDILREAPLPVLLDPTKDVANTQATPEPSYFFVETPVSWENFVATFGRSIMGLSLLDIKPYGDHALLSTDRVAQRLLLLPPGVRPPILGTISELNLTSRGSFADRPLVNRSHRLLQNPTEYLRNLADLKQKFPYYFLSLERDSAPVQRVEIPTIRNHTAKGILVLAPPKGFQKLANIRDPGVFEYAVSIIQGKLNKLLDNGVRVNNLEKAIYIKVYRFGETLRVDVRFYLPDFTKFKAKAQMEDQLHQLETEITDKERHLKKLQQIEGHIESQVSSYHMRLHHMAQLIDQARRQGQSGLVREFERIMAIIDPQLRAQLKTLEGNRRRSGEAREALAYLRQRQVVTSQQLGVSVAEHAGLQERWNEISQENRRHLMRIDPDWYRRLHPVQKEEPHNPWSAVETHLRAQLYDQGYVPSHTLKPDD